MHMQRAELMHAVNVSETESIFSWDIAVPNLNNQVHGACLVQSCTVYLATCCMQSVTIGQIPHA